MHLNFFADGITSEDCLILARKPINISEGQLISQKVLTVNLITIGNINVISMTTPASYMTINRSTLNSAFSDRPTFRL